MGFSQGTCFVCFVRSVGLITLYFGACIPIVSAKLLSSTSFTANFTSVLVFNPISPFPLPPPPPRKAPIKSTETNSSYVHVGNSKKSASFLLSLPLSLTRLHVGRVTHLHRSGPASALRRGCSPGTCRCAPDAGGCRAGPKAAAACFQRHPIPGKHNLSCPAMLTLSSGLMAQQFLARFVDVGRNRRLLQDRQRTDWHLPRPFAPDWQSSDEPRASRVGGGWGVGGERGGGGRNGGGGGEKGLLVLCRHSASLHG